MITLLDLWIQANLNYMNVWYTFNLRKDTHSIVYICLFYYSIKNSSNMSVPNAEIASQKLSTKRKVNDVYEDKVDSAPKRQCQPATMVNSKINTLLIKRDGNSGWTCQVGIVLKSFFV